MKLIPSFEDFNAINEKLITFGNKAYPRYNNIVIMAGGAASGKGFIIDNILGIEGKILDVDSLKVLSLASNRLYNKLKGDLRDIDQLDLKNPKHVSALHTVISSYKWADKKEEALFKQIVGGHVDLKPNLIFDVTLKDIFRLENISTNVINIGYKPEDIHIVWVINDIDTASVQNTQRDRRVDDDILRDIHRSVASLMKQFLTNSIEIQKWMNGDFWLAFNKKGFDIAFDKSHFGGSYIKEALTIKIKDKGKPIKQFKEIDNDIIDKIESYTKIKFRE